MDEEKYRFVAEWFDPTVKVKRTFLLTFYPKDGSVEMGCTDFDAKVGTDSDFWGGVIDPFGIGSCNGNGQCLLQYDVNLKRPFLKRIKCDTADLTDFYVGSIINVLSRQLNLVDYGDGATRNRFTQHSEVCLAIIKESGFSKMGKIIDIMQKNDLSVTKGRMMKILENDNCFGMENSSFFHSIIPGIFIVLEIRGNNAITTWLQLLGTTECASSKDTQIIVKPLQAELGDFKSFCIGPTERDSVQRELDIFFSPDSTVHCNTAVFRDSTCCIIKPHALREGLSGKIIQAILDGGFQITALEMITMDFATAAEFYEVYKGVVADYKEMTVQLVSGSCMALEISSSHGSNTPQEFRKLVGPANPEIARQLRPSTLRARFGHDKVKNAVHCTDLSEDALLEVEYLFKILAL